ncbi:hypothetical protein RB653_010368 [Dictyostelium firmibasis]|uniref:Cytochrome P450 n=1 Tax=Dictyostelium firmibasis TaxID=79012 RepID=A0AAN7TSR6_9MYCE
MNLFSILFYLIACYLVLDFIKKNKRNKNEVPILSFALPIIGHLYKLGINPHRNLTKLVKNNGGIYSLWLGDIKTIIVTDPLINKEIMVNQFKNFCDRPKLKSFESFTGGGVNLIFIDYSQNWSEVRKIVSSSITKTKILSNYRDVIENQTKILINSMRNINEPFKIKKYLGEFSINIVLEIMFKQNKINNDVENNPIEKLTEPIQQVFLLLGTGNISDFIKIFRPLFRHEYRKLKNSSEKVFKFMEEIYDNHLIQFDPSNLRDLMDQFIQYEKTNFPNSTPIEKKINIIKGCMSFVFAGDDTVASTLEWVCLYLINNPIIQEKCYEEIISVFGNENKSFVSLKDRDKCQYLINVIKETLRIRPPLPLSVPRIATQDCKINGYFIKKGTQILSNTFGMSHLYVDQPDKFNPDRWLEYYNQKNQNIEQHNKYYNDLDRVSLPFSSGPRNCVGLSIAELNVFSVCSNIILNFQIKSIDGKQLDDTEVSGISIHPKQYSIKLIPRN